MLLHITSGTASQFDKDRRRRAIQCYVFRQRTIYVIVLNSQRPKQISAHRILAPSPGRCLLAAGAGNTWPKGKGMAANWRLAGSRALRARTPH